jgi:hypothetical protein
MRDALRQLTYFVPEADAEKVRAALHAVGAGNIGEYSACSFSGAGTGRFTPSSQANPKIGQAGQAEEVAEVKVDMLYPKHLESAVLGTLFKAHPYEEVAYYCTSLGNSWQDVGAGFVGELTKPMSASDFTRYLKEKLNLNYFRHTPWLGKPIQRIALCGGAGSFLLADAIHTQADVYISGDFKYHEFFDAENHLTICDIGHYESEVMIKDTIHEYLSNNFSTFAVLKSMTHTNPVSLA